MDYGMGYYGMGASFRLEFKFTRIWLVGWLLKLYITALKLMRSAGTPRQTAKVSNIPTKSLLS